MALKIVKEGENPVDDPVTVNTHTVLKALRDSIEEAKDFKAVDVLVILRDADGEICTYTNNAEEALHLLVDAQQLEFIDSIEWVDA